MADVCVIGAGPAGSVFAARMAQLGHTVTLVERARFPRRHLGESLSPGVRPLLDTVGAREAIESAGLQRVRRVLVHWDGDAHVREDPREEGLLVDRGIFDQLLLDRAQSLGVRVLQPARAVERTKTAQGWAIQIVTETGTIVLRADFLADAGGRSSGAAQRHRTGCSTLALYAYWRGSDLPREPRIEAGDNAWYWGVPLPDGTYNTLIFVDPVEFRATRSGSVHAEFLSRLCRSGLLAGSRYAQLATLVQAIDATPYLAEDYVTATSLRVGEAALAIDPVSSSGVQKAIQSALAAAIVANTLLRRPDSVNTSMCFYRANLEEASLRHARWAAGYYGKVAARRGGKFWHDRGAGAEPNPMEQPKPPLDVHAITSSAFALSQQLEFVDLPCIEGDFVVTKGALRHPNLDGPIVYLGGQELAPLLRGVRPGLTPMQLAQAWSGRVPLQSGLAIAGWLVNNELLVPESQPHAHGPA